MYLQGSREKLVIKRNSKRAAELFQRGCDAGEGVACDVLAHLYATGQGVPKSRSIAKRLRQRAIRLGFEEE
jgi:uncharacterized protein